MKKAGFKTGMFSSNGYVSSKWGFDRGWDVNRNFIRESLANGSEFLWKTTKAWLTPIVAKKQFAYLATIEPHVAYAPRKEFLVKYWDKAYVGPNQAGAVGRPARPHQGRQAQGHRQRQEVPRGAARRRDLPERRRVRDLHR